MRIGLGVFDGLHKGHLAIAGQVDCLVTFSPHPDVVLNKNPQLLRLSTLSELRCISPVPVHTLRFSKAMASMSPDDFLKQVIMPTFNPQKIVVGYDFKFGAKRQGNHQFLTEWGKANGVAIEVVPPACHGDIPIKSSDIRTYLLEGAFDTAVHLLGHPYLIEGKVIHGEKRGRQLGFPTANLVLPADKLIPANGVFSGEVKLGKKTIHSMIYIGNKPTFGGKKTVVEVFLYNFDGNLYGKTLKVFLKKKLRGEKQFSSKDELIAQLQHDLQSSFH